MAHTKKIFKKKEKEIQTSRKDGEIKKKTEPQAPFQ